MNRLYLFNPENDLALAADTPHFTPPAAALRLAKSAAALPLWYASAGDTVLARDVDIKWYERTAELFGLEAVLSSYVQNDVRDVRPWGWSKYACNIFMGYGVEPTHLPGDHWLDIHRRLSHRRLTIAVYKQLAESNLPYPLPDIPLEISEVAQIEAMLAGGEHLFVKSPWSGSGRGVIDSCSAPARQVLRLAAGVIRRQGSVLVERALDKVCDFAMLYDMDGAQARYAGMSLFYNEGYSAYTGNILMSDERIFVRLADMVGCEAILATRQAVASALKSTVRDGYTGPVGVDMMIYRDYGRLLIAPCIEVNMRMTMGRVAHALTERYLADGVTGMMKIVRTTANQHGRLNATVENHRLVRGDVSLTSPCDEGFAVLMSVTS